MSGINQHSTESPKESGFKEPKPNTDNKDERKKTKKTESGPCSNRFKGRFGGRRFKHPTQTRSNNSSSSSSGDDDERWSSHPHRRKYKYFHHTDEKNRGTPHKGKMDGFGYRRRQWTSRYFKRAWQPAKAVKGKESFQGKGKKLLPPSLPQGSKKNDYVKPGFQALLNARGDFITRALLSGASPAETFDSPVWQALNQVQALSTLVPPTPMIEESRKQLSKRQRRRLAKAKRKARLRSVVQDSTLSKKIFNILLPRGNYNPGKSQRNAAKKKRDELLREVNSVLQKELVKEEEDEPEPPDGPPECSTPAESLAAQWSSVPKKYGATSSIAEAFHKAQETILNFQTNLNAPLVESDHSDSLSRQVTYHTLKENPGVEVVEVIIAPKARNESSSSANDPVKVEPEEDMQGNRGNGGLRGSGNRIPVRTFIGDEVHIDWRSNRGFGRGRHYNPPPPRFGTSSERPWQKNWESTVPHESNNWRGGGQGPAESMPWSGNTNNRNIGRSRFDMDEDPFQLTMGPQGFDQQRGQWQRSSEEWGQDTGADRDYRPPFRGRGGSRDSFDQEKWFLDQFPWDVNPPQGIDRSSEEWNQNASADQDYRPGIRERLGSRDSFEEKWYQDEIPWEDKRGFSTRRHRGTSGWGRRTINLPERHTAPFTRTSLSETEEQKPTCSATITTTSSQLANLEKSLKLEPVSSSASAIDSESDWSDFQGPTKKDKEVKQEVKQEDAQKKSEPPKNDDAEAAAGIKSEENKEPKEQSPKKEIRKAQDAKTQETATTGEKTLKSSEKADEKDDRGSKARSRETSQDETGSRRSKEAADSLVLSKDLRDKIREKAQGSPYLKNKMRERDSIHSSSSVRDARGKDQESDRRTKSKRIDSKTDGEHSEGTASRKGSGEKSTPVSKDSPTKETRRDSDKKAAPVNEKENEKKSASTKESEKRSDKKSAPTKENEKGTDKKSAPTKENEKGTDKKSAATKEKENEKKSASTKENEKRSDKKSASALESEKSSDKKSAPTEENEKETDKKLEPAVQKERKSDKSAPAIAKEKENEKSSAPTRENEKSSDKKLVPSKEIEKGTDKKSAPTKENEEGTEKNSAPTKENEKGTEKKSAPTKENEKGTEKKSAPTKENEKGTDKKLEPAVEKERKSDKSAQAVENEKRNEKNSAPTRENEKSSDKKSAPTKENEKGTDKKSAPTKDNEKSSDKKSAPTKENEKSSDKKSAPTKENEKGTEKKSAPTKESEKGTEKKSAPALGNEKSSDRKSAPTKESEKGTDKKCAPTKENEKATKPASHTKTTEESEKLSHATRKKKKSDKKPRQTEGKESDSDGKPALITERRRDSDRKFVKIGEKRKGHDRKPGLIGEKRRKSGIELSPPTKIRGNSDKKSAPRKERRRFSDQPPAPVKEKKKDGNSNSAPTKETRRYSDQLPAPVKENRKDSNLKSTPTEATKRDSEKKSTPVIETRTVTITRKMPALKVDKGKDVDKKSTPTGTTPEASTPMSTCSFAVEKPSIATIPLPTDEVPTPSVKTSMNTIPITTSRGSQSPRKLAATSTTSPNRSRVLKNVTPGPISFQLKSPTKRAPILINVLSGSTGNGSNPAKTSPPSKTDRASKEKSPPDVFVFSAKSVANTRASSEPTKTDRASKKTSPPDTSLSSAQSITEIWPPSEPKKTDGAPREKSPSVSIANSITEIWPSSDPPKTARAPRERSPSDMSVSSVDSDIEIWSSSEQTKPDRAPREKSPSDMSVSSVDSDIEIWSSSTPTKTVSGAKSVDSDIVILSSSGPTKTDGASKLKSPCVSSSKSVTNTMPSSRLTKTNATKLKSPFKSGTKSVATTKPSLGPVTIDGASRKKSPSDVPASGPMKTDKASDVSVSSVANTTPILVPVPTSPAISSVGSSPLGSPPPVGREKTLAATFQALIGITQILQQSVTADGAGAKGFKEKGATTTPPSPSPKQALGIMKSPTTSASCSDAQFSPPAAQTASSPKKKITAAVFKSPVAMSSPPENASGKSTDIVSVQGSQEGKDTASSPAGPTSVAPGSAAQGRSIAQSGKQKTGATTCVDPKPATKGPIPESDGSTHVDSKTAAQTQVKQKPHVDPRKAATVLAKRRPTSVNLKTAAQGKPSSESTKVDPRKATQKQPNAISINTEARAKLTSKPTKVDPGKAIGTQKQPSAISVKPEAQANQTGVSTKVDPGKTTTAQPRRVSTGGDPKTAVKAQKQRASVSPPVDPRKAAQVQQRKVSTSVDPKAPEMPADVVIPKDPRKASQVQQTSVSASPSKDPRTAAQAKPTASILVDPRTAAQAPKQQTSIFSANLDPRTAAQAQPQETSISTNVDSRTAAQVQQTGISTNLDPRTAAQVQQTGISTHVDPRTAAQAQAQQTSISTNLDPRTAAQVQQTGISTHVDPRTAAQAQAQQTSISTNLDPRTAAQAQAQQTDVPTHVDPRIAAQRRRSLGSSQEQDFYPHPPPADNRDRPEHFAQDSDYFSQDGDYYSKDQSYYSQDRNYYSGDAVYYARGQDYYPPDPYYSSREAPHPSTPAREYYHYGEARSRTRWSSQRPGPTSYADRRPRPGLLGDSPVDPRSRHQGSGYPNYGNPRQPPLSPSTPAPKHDYSEYVDPRSRQQSPRQPPDYHRYGNQQARPWSPGQRTNYPGYVDPRTRHQTEFPSYGDDYPGNEYQDYSSYSDLPASGQQPEYPGYGDSRDGPQEKGSEFASYVDPRSSGQRLDFSNYTDPRTGARVPVQRPRLAAGDFGTTSPRQPPCRSGLVPLSPAVCSSSPTTTAVTTTTAAVTTTTAALAVMSDATGTASSTPTTAVTAGITAAVSTSTTAVTTKNAAAVSTATTAVTAKITAAVSESSTITTTMNTATVSTSSTTAISTSLSSVKTTTSAAVTRPSTAVDSRHKATTQRKAGARTSDSDSSALPKAPFKAPTAATARATATTGTSQTARLPEKNTAEKSGPAATLSKQLKTGRISHKGSKFRPHGDGHRGGNTVDDSVSRSGRSGHRDENTDSGEDMESDTPVDATAADTSSSDSETGTKENAGKTVSDATRMKYHSQLSDSLHDDTLLEFEDIVQSSDSDDDLEDVDFIRKERLRPRKTPAQQRSLQITSDEEAELAPSTTNLDDLVFEPSFLPKAQFSIDSLVQERRAENAEQKELDNIRTELQKEIEKGGLAHLVKSIEAEQRGEEDMLPEHEHQLRRLAVAQQAIQDSHPGAPVFDSRRYLCLYSFPDTLTLSACGFVPGSGYMDKYLASAEGGPEMLLEFLTSNVVELCFETTASPKELLSWAFYLMAIHRNSRLIHRIYNLLYNLLHRQSGKACSWVPTVKDLARVFVNYGATLEDLCPGLPFTEAELSLREENKENSPIGIQRLEEDQRMEVDPVDAARGYSVENLQFVVRTVSVAVTERYSKYNCEDLVSMITMLMKVALDERLKLAVLKPDFEVCLAALLNGFTTMDWAEEVLELCMMLAHCAGTHHHNMLYITQLLPCVDRGRYLQRHLAYTFLRQLLGKIVTAKQLINFRVADLYPLLQQLPLGQHSDFYFVSSFLGLLDCAVGNSTLREKESLKVLRSSLHNRISEIRDYVSALDRTMVKDTMVRLTSKWFFMLQNMSTTQQSLFAYARPVSENPLSSRASHNTLSVEEVIGSQETDSEEDFSDQTSVSDLSEVASDGHCVLEKQ